VAACAAPPGRPHGGVGGGMLWVMSLYMV
jgi:hypothetical protein